MFRVWGSGFEVHGLGFGVGGWGPRVWDLWSLDGEASWFGG